MSTGLAERVAQRATNEPQAGQVEQRPAGPPDLRQFVHTMRGEIARALPAHMAGSSERMARIVLTDLMRVKNLAACTQSSFAGAMMTAVQLGLEPGGVGGEAYLLPFWSNQIGQHEVQLVIGYQGMAKLFWQHPLAAGLDAREVRENDDFEYEYGLDPVLRHKPARRNRGAVTDYYAVARLSNGGNGFVVLSVDDVETFRRRSKQANKGPWVNDYDAMARKTCVRQLFKLLPKSPELARALAHDGAVRRDPSLDGIDAAPEYIEGELADEPTAEQESTGDAPAWPNVAPVGGTQ
ncbi:recombinase RecT [Embleya sp. MST-111070]|uniref:recombinase RecT n=1 Tax=Embleya sp. MST-111070 TaxID=3398231 RepID=UPI003F73315D